MQANNSYDRSYDGAGLGLSVVKGLAKLHGGRLELESRLGEGTIATIVLPLEGAGESERSAARVANGVGGISVCKDRGFGPFSISLVSDAKMAKGEGRDASWPLGIL